MKNRTANFSMYEALSQGAYASLFTCETNGDFKYIEITVFQPQHMLYLKNIGRPTGARLQRIQ